MTAAPAHAHDTSSVFKPAMLIMAGQGVAFAATFFIPVVLARALTPLEFGTYKQLFLIYSTAWLIGQAGMASSLYYFVPRSPGDLGRFAANATCFLGVAGLVCFGLVCGAASHIARWMSNAELAGYIPWIALYLLLMLVAAPLEIVLVQTVYRDQQDVPNVVRAGGDGAGGRERHRHSNHQRTEYRARGLATHIQFHRLILTLLETSPSGKCAACCC